MFTVAHDVVEPVGARWTGQRHTESEVESEDTSEASTEIEVTGESEPIMESDPISLLMEPAEARWIVHGHTRQPAGTQSATIRSGHVGSGHGRSTYVV